MINVKELDDELLEKVNGGENDIPSYCLHDESSTCTQCPYYHVTSVSGTVNYTENIKCDLNQFEEYNYEYKRHH